MPRAADRDEGSSSDADLLEARRSLVAALLANDADAIARHFDEDWIAVHAGGPMSRAELCDAVRAGRLSHRTFDDVGATRIRRTGDSAVRTTRVLSSGSVARQDYEADEWITDVLRLEDSRWICVLSQKTAAE